jgi:GT2 family glycosyltransferase/glycosyltransferase involved in cell wall biosynthesis
VEDIEGFTNLPLISVLMPVYNTPEKWLIKAIDSVINQIYPYWELCISDNASSDQRVKEILTNYRSLNNKIKVVFKEINSGISENTNSCLRISEGNYIALLDSDDELSSDALYWVAKEINQFPDVDLIFSDECKLDIQGNMVEFFYKPGWNPEMLLNSMYTGHLSVYKKEIVNLVGGFRKEYDFSQDYDLALRVTELTQSIRHIPRILYYWRKTDYSGASGKKPFARESNIAALKDAVKRRNWNAEVLELPSANRVKFNDNNSIFQNNVSIIIPSGFPENAIKALNEIYNNTEYENYEIILITDSSSISLINKEFKKNIKFYPYDAPYNFSDKCNKGASIADGNILVFLNDDVFPLDKNWLRNLLEFLNIKNIGGVSPKLIYEDETIQYAGMISGVRRLIGTSFHKLNKSDTSYFNMLQCVRDVSILSGACLAIRKDVFNEIGCFDEDLFPTSHSDVDLSFKMLKKGYRCVYTPYSELLHIGHMTERKTENKNKKTKADINLLKKWGSFLSSDIYFPEPMKKSLYKDSPEYYKIYADIKISNNNNFKKDILLLSHDLSYTGAPIMLFNLAKLLKTEGYFVTILSPIDGPLLNYYNEINIPVIIDELALNGHDSIVQLAKNFDNVVFNTCLFFKFINLVNDNHDNIIWWIHESMLIDELSKNNEFINALKVAKRVITPSKYSEGFIKKYRNNKIDLIYNGIEDKVSEIYRNDESKLNPNKKLLFLILGTIEPRKGQDLAVKAFLEVNKELSVFANLLIVGNHYDKNFYSKIQTQISSIDNISILPLQTPDNALKLINNSDVIISSSRDDAFPIVTIESMMLSKITVVSSCVGTKDFINNGFNGFVFNLENPNELTIIIEEIIKNYINLDFIKINARKTYLEKLNNDVFLSEWKKILG